MMKTCGKQSGMSTKLSTVIEYKIDEIQNVYGGTIVSIVIMDPQLHIMYHSGIANQQGSDTYKSSSRPKRRGSNAHALVGFVSSSSEIESAEPPTPQRPPRVNFAVMNASSLKRKTTKRGSEENASFDVTSTEHLQDLVRSFKQSTDAFARSLREFRDDTPRAIHMSGHSHIFSFFDGGDLALGFYTKLSEERIESFDYGKVNKNMRQIIEELCVLMRNALGTASS